MELLGEYPRNSEHHCAESGAYALRVLLSAGVIRQLRFERLII